jgi:hypothetical protein
MEVPGQLHALAGFSPEEKKRHIFDRRLGGPQSRSERCGEEKTRLPLPGIEIRPAIPSVIPALDEIESDD